MTIESGHMDTYQEYSQFSSLDEFNQHIEMWMVDLKHHFTKGERIGLKRLIRYAAKLPGVCHAKIGTILKAIREDLGELAMISRATFKRMVQKATQLGLLVIYETARKNGSQSCNLYVFQRYPQTITNRPTHAVEVTKQQPTQVVSTQPQQPLNHTYTDDRVPTSFVRLVKCFYNDAKMIEEFWRMTTIAAYQHCLETDHETVLSLSISSMKQLVRKIKQHNRIKNPIAYYFGIFSKKCKETYFETLENIHPASPVATESLYQSLIDRIPQLQ